jgi:hypothetical protein
MDMYLHAYAYMYYIICMSYMYMYMYIYVYVYAYMYYMAYIYVVYYIHVCISCTGPQEREREPTRCASRQCQVIESNESDDAIDSMRRPTIALIDPIMKPRERRSMQAAACKVMPFYASAAIRILQIQTSLCARGAFCMRQHVRYLFICIAVEMQIYICIAVRTRRHAGALVRFHARVGVL